MGGAALAQLDAEASAPSAPTAPALLELVDRDGLVRQSWRIERWPVSIGRALDNTIVLSDPYVAARHATIDVVPGVGAAPSAIVVAAGETKNGVVLGRRDRVAGGATREIADVGRDLELQVGRAQLRLRLPGHSLAAEQPMSAVADTEQRWAPTLGFAAAVLLFVLAATWIDTDPEALVRSAGMTLLSTIAGGAIWCGLWALLSKTFTRQSHFGWHVRVFVVASLALLVLSVVPPLIAFAFSWPWVTDFSFIAVYATGATAIYFHLLAVEPSRRRLMRGVAATGFVVGVALSLWFNVQRSGRFGEELYMNHLFPPQLRIARPKSVDRFVGGLAPMQAILDKQAKERGGGEGEDARGDDDE
ncbi:MAG: FHA domain-containing protein [Rhizobacter sp.]|nr:FHA domain-containing protein [Rhizobacter sp.]